MSYLVFNRMRYAYYWVIEEIESQTGDVYIRKSKMYDGEKDALDAGKAEADRLTADGAEIKTYYVEEVKY